MIEIKYWMDTFLQTLNATFGDRIFFIGLQGSYGRGEATQSSDIDVVVILDELSHCDLCAYRGMLDTLPNRELVCGFLSGKDEILNWEPSDLFQFYYDTKPIQGSLDALLALLDSDAVKRAIKIGVCNIYHGCVHNMLHENSDETLRALYKTASFVVQAIYFQKTGQYISNREQLLAMAMPDERKIVEIYTDMKTGAKIQFDDASEYLFTWSKKWISHCFADDV